MTKACCIWLISLFYLHVQAQTGFQLSGKVTDTAGIALSRATIQWVAGSDTLNTLTGDDGIFSMKNLKVRKFTISITMKGFLPFSHSYSVAPDKHSIKLQPIALQADYSELDPVTVTRIRPISIQGDTVSYNAAAFPVRDGSEVEDILKRLPGIEVDINGNVVIQGKPLTKVLINGREFFGSDVLLAIQNLPADVVEKLQVIDDYGDKARLTGVKSGESAKVLNIILKTDERNGEFGRLEGGGGTQGKFESSTFADVFRNECQFSLNGSLSNNSPSGIDLVKHAGINYADQWTSQWSGAFNVNSGNQNPHSANSYTSITNYPSENLQQAETNVNTSHNQNNNFSSQLTFKQNSYSTLRFTSSAVINQSFNQANSNFSTLQKDIGFTKSTTGQSANSSQSTQNNLTSTLYYEKVSIQSRQRFSIEASAGYSGSNQSANMQSTAAVITDSVASNSLLQYVTGNQSHTWNLNLNSNYFLPLGPTSFLEMGYWTKSLASVNNSLTRQPDSVNGILQTIDSLSKNMALRSLTQDIHTAYMGRLSQLDLTAVLDAQSGQQRGTVDSKGDIVSYHYFSTFPNLQAVWKFDKSRKVHITYNSQPNVPGLQQLAPFTNISNPQYPVTGNPNLRPSYTSNIAIHYEEFNLKPTKFFRFEMGINYSSTHHTIIQNMATPKDSGQVIQEITYLNAGNTNNLSADYQLTLPAFLNNRLRINYNGNLGKSQTITMTNSIQFPTQTSTWSQTLHLILMIPNLIESDLSANYSNTRSVYPAASSSLPNSFRSASLAFTSRHYFFHNWILNYQFAQSYTSEGDRLQTAPPMLTASIQRQFVPHNMVTIIFTGYNLFNQSATVGQSISATTISQTRPELNGRYFLLSFQVNLKHFHH